MISWRAKSFPPRRQPRSRTSSPSEGLGRRIKVAHGATRLELPPRNDKRASLPPDYSRQSISQGRALSRKIRRYRGRLARPARWRGKTKIWGGGGPEGGG